MYNTESITNQIELICKKMALMSDLYELLTFETHVFFQYALEFYDTTITSKIYISCYMVDSEFKWAVLDIIDYDATPHSERLPKNVFYRIANSPEYLLQSLERWLTLFVKP